MDVVSSSRLLVSVKVPVPPDEREPAPVAQRPEANVLSLKSSVP